MKGRVCSWEPRQRDSGGWEQRSLRWGLQGSPHLHPTPRRPPGLLHERRHSDVTAATTLHVTLVTSTRGHSVSPHKERIPLQTPGDPRAQSQPLHKEGCQERFRRAPAWAGRAVCLANELNKVPVAGGALSVSHLVPYRRSDLRCGWVSRVAGHQGKQFQRGRRWGGKEPAGSRTLGKWGCPAEDVLGLGRKGSPSKLCSSGASEEVWKNTWQKGPELQRDQSSEKSIYFLLSHWDVLWGHRPVLGPHGASSRPHFQDAGGVLSIPCLGTALALGQLQGDLSKTTRGMQEGLAQPGCTCRTCCPALWLHTRGFWALLHPATPHFWAARRREPRWAPAQGPHVPGGE